MPTAKPRIQVTLPPHQHELLRRLAELQGRSMSAIIAELFEQVYPVLERVAVVLQAATRAQHSMKEGLRESTAQAERDMRPLVASALGQLDLLQMEFDRASPSEGAPPGAAPLRKATPGLVTRGSGLTARTHTNRARLSRSKVKSVRRPSGKSKRRSKR